jgi:taurine transport system permease protein
MPFAALWFGTRIGRQIMIVFAGTFPPCLLNAYRGARFVDKRLFEAAQMLGTGNFGAITEVLLPAAVPSIVAGLRAVTLVTVQIVGVDGGYTSE